VTDSSEAQALLRLKRSAIAEKEARLNSVLSKRRRELLHLLGAGVP